MTTPVFGGVYKLSGVEDENGNITPKIKISENVSKITTPGFKNLWRLYDRETGKAIADLITMNDEVIDETKPYEIFDPDHIWKRKVIKNFKAVNLRKKIFENGKNISKRRELKDIRK